MNKHEDRRMKIWSTNKGVAVREDEVTSKIMFILIEKQRQLFKLLLRINSCCKLNENCKLYEMMDEAKCSQKMKNS